MDRTRAVIEAQLDWVTATNDGTAHREAFRAFASALCDAERDLGGLTTPFKLHRYYGWRVGRVGYGQQGERSLIAISGDLADKAFTSVSEMATNITRIDAAVTVRVQPNDADIAAEGYNVATGHYKPGGKYPQPTYIASARGGTTFYLGDRTSETFLRLYDKGRESRDREYTDCWRYEVESKGTVARGLAVACARRPDRAAFCEGYVYDAFYRRSIPPWFDLSGERVYQRGFRRRSDVDSKLDWFRRSIAPTVAKLVREGRADDVRAALGL